ncbi:MAG: methyltransferase domain-containing protein [Lachnospira sp.]
MEKIIIFGKGTYWNLKKETLEHEYEIEVILDNSVESDEIYENKIVTNPINISKYPDSKIYIMVYSFFDIINQLISLGVEPERIVIPINIKPYNNEFEYILDSLGYKFDITKDEIVIRNCDSRYIVHNIDEIKDYARELGKQVDPMINSIIAAPVKPLSSKFGSGRGTPIDRYYIERFLEDNKNSITGDVMEIADNTYTYQFGNDLRDVKCLHVNGWGKNAIKGNLETGEGIVENSVDCLICTQTVQFIYELDSVAMNIYKMLKPGGTALITATGISYLSMYDYNRWGEYWKFTRQSMNRMFEKYFKKDNIKVDTYGNCKVAMGMLYGLCREDFTCYDLDYRDEQFPVVVVASITK